MPQNLVTTLQNNGNAVVRERTNMVTCSPVGLSPEKLSAVFPFHIVLDHQLCIVQIGAALARRYPEMKPGCRFGDHFRLARPEIVVSYETIVQWKHTVFVLEKTGDLLRLKGQMDSLENDGLLVFLGFPWVADVEEIDNLGLSLGDFPLHDQTADHLITLHTQRLALEDARNLTMQLSRQRAELTETNRRLRSSEDRYRSVVENVTEVIFQADEKGRITYLNRAWEDVTGFTVAESLGQPFTRYIHPEDLAWNLDCFHALMAGRVEYCRHQMRHLTRDGGLRWVEVFVRLTLNEQSRMIGTSGTLMDVTERKAAEDTLREREERLRSIVNTAVEGIIVIDHDGLIESFNPAAEAIFGYLQAEVIGRNVVMLMPAEHAGHHQQYIEQYLRTRARRIIGIGREVEALRKDGTIFPIELSVSEMVLGERRKFTGIVRDITERKQAEEALKQARERELEIGGRIQRTLLTRSAPTDLAGVSFGVCAIPSLRVDGDYLDFFIYDNMRFDVLLGDVMGKDVAAALLAAAAKSQFQRANRRLAQGLAPFGRLPEPQEVVAMVHAQIGNELASLESFITVIYACFDLKKRTVTLVDCGHTRTIRLRQRTNTCELLCGDNLPLGVSAKEEFVPVVFDIEPGDLFFFYSDGVTEAHNASGEFFGEERLVELVRAYAALPADQLTDFIRTQIADFTGSNSVQDDLTCLAVRFSDPLPSEPVVHQVMEIRGDLEQLETARNFVHHFCEHEINPPMDPVETDMMVLSVNECVSNVILHAYKGRKNERIQIVANAYRDQVQILVYDWGASFDPDDVPEPEFDGSAEGGFGIYIIRACMDEVRYGRDDLGRNCFTLTKKLARS